MKVFLVPGMNTRPEEAQSIASWARAVAPDRIQLSTAVRPPAEAGITAMTREAVAPLAQWFEPKAEIIADFRTSVGGFSRGDAEAIMAMLRRRPRTVSQIACACAMHRTEAVKLVGFCRRTVGSTGFIGKPGISSLRPAAGRAAALH